MALVSFQEQLKVHWFPLIEHVVAYLAYIFGFGAAFEVYYLFLLEEILHDQRLGFENVESHGFPARRNLRICKIALDCIVNP